MLANQLDTPKFHELLKSIEMLSIPELFNKNSVINNLKDKMIVRKDCIYMCFARIENETGPNTYRIRDTLYSFEKIFKFKFYEGSIKVEYYGELDDNITNFIHNFFEDFDTFINGKFIKKCMRQSLLQLKKIKPNSEKSDKKSKSKLKFKEVNLDKLLMSSKDLEKTEEIQETVSKTPEKPKPSFDNVELYKSEIVKKTVSDNQIKKSNSEVNLQNKKVEKVSINETKERPDDLEEYCNQLIKEINESKIDLGFDDIKNEERELEIYSKFLEKYRDYKKYCNDKSEWKQETKKDNMTIWSRIDSPYMVRKVQISAKLDPELLEDTMNNFSLAPKWNPMLGI